MPPKKYMMKVINQAINNQVKWETDVVQINERAKCAKSKEKLRAVANKKLKAATAKPKPKTKTKMTITKKRK